MLSLKQIVDHYNRNVRHRARAENAWYGKARDIMEGIKRAARCELENGKRHPHQYRIAPSVLKLAEQALLTQAPAIATCESFDELHSLVHLRIRPIRGVGELMVYDVTHRIALAKKLVPTKVYLHAGTRKGARALGIRGVSVDLKVFPDEFQALSAAELEDLLCIYKDALTGKALPNQLCRPVSRSRCAPSVPPTSSRY